MNEILSQVFSAGTFTQMLRSATPVALAAMGVQRGKLYFWI